MRKKNLIGGAGFLALALFGVEESLRLPLGGWHHPEPGLFPLLLSLLLLVMALALVFSSFGGPAAGQEFSLALLSQTSRKVWLTFAALLGFSFLMEPVGFLLSTFLLLAFLLRAIAARGWTVTVAVGAGAAISSYMLFDRLLKLPLPKGLIGF